MGHVLLFSHLANSRFSAELAPLSMAVQSIMAICFSHMLPYVNRRLGTDWVNTVGLVGYGNLLMLLSQSADSEVQVITIMGLSGCCIAVIDCNPFIICDRLVGSSCNTRATMISMLDNTMNVAQVFTAIALGTL